MQRGAGGVRSDVRTRQGHATRRSVRSGDSGYDYPSHPYRPVYVFGQRCRGVDRQVFETKGSAADQSGCVGIEVSRESATPSRRTPGSGRRTLLRPATAAPLHRLMINPADRCAPTRRGDAVAGARNINDATAERLLEPTERRAAARQRAGCVNGAGSPTLTLEDGHHPHGSTEPGAHTRHPTRVRPGPPRTPRAPSRLRLSHDTR
jgi:hypothetical protein